MTSKNPWRKLKQNLLLKSEYDHRVYIDDVLAPSGKRSTYFRVALKDNVTILALNRDGKVILERQWRYPIGAESAELPAGGVEKDEEPLAAAKRELKEETGYSQGKWIFLGWHYVDTGFMKTKTFSFLVIDVEEGETSLDENERILVDLVDFDELYRQVLCGEIKETRSKLTLLLAKEYLNTRKK